MKKRLVILLAGLLTVLSMGFGSAQFSDVPAGHWAKEAVEAIAAQGLIIGFPDGTFRGNENLTRYQAALIIYRLLQQLQGQQGQPAPKMDEETLNTIRNAVQELAAELAALGVRVSALEDNAASKDDIARLDAAIEELKKAKPEGGMDQQALSDLADRVEAASVAADTALAQAQQLADRLEAVEGDVATVKTQLEADADSIRALNELSVLLNQDVLSLQDRVTALEKNLGALSETDFNEFATKEDVAAVQEFATALRGDLVRLSDRVSALSTTVDGLNNRLTAVEGTRPSLTGSLTARYGYRYTTGPNFDIDRLFPGQGFANGNDGADLAGNSDTFAQADLTFSLKRTATTTAGFNFTEASAALRIPGTSGSVYINDAIQLRSFSVKGNIDGQDFSLSYSRALAYKFNDYFFEDTGTNRGAVVSFNASKAFLSPKITVVLGSSGTAGSGQDDFFGIRTAVNLLGLNASLNYGERNVLNSAAAPSYSGFGTDFNGKLFGLLDVNGGYFLSKSNANASINFATDPQVFYLTGGVSLGPVNLSGNYRAVDSRFNSGGANAGLLNNNDDQPFATDNRGFGALGSVKLGFLSLNGYYDSSTDFNLNNPQTALGFGVSANLFAGFSLTGYFNSTSNAAGQVYMGNNPYGTNGPETRAAFGSNLGARLAHDGSAPNALLGGLNLFAEYRQSQGTNADFGSSGSRTDLAFGASYALNLGFLSITPDVRYHSYGAASTPGSEVSYNTLKYGVQLSTQTLNLGFIKPSLSGNFASRTTNFASGSNASETRFGVGLSFADFLLPGATFSANAAQVQGTNVDATLTRSCGDSAFSVDTDCLYNGPGTDFGPITPAANAYTLKGLFFSYTYAGAGIWSGVFDYDQGSDGTVDSVGRGFRIFYSLKF